MRYDEPDARPPPPSTPHYDEQRAARHRVTPTDSYRHRVSPDALPTETSVESTRLQIFPPVIGTDAAPVGPADTDCHRHPRNEGASIVLSSPVFTGTEPVSPTELLVGLERAYRESRGAEHHGPSISVSNARKRLSYLRRALEHPSVVSLSDLRGILVDLPGLARSVHPDAAGAVRLALRDAFGFVATGRQQIRHGLSLLPASLQRLSALRVPPEKDPTGVLGQLLRVAIFCGHANAPRTLPSAGDLRDAAMHLTPPVAAGSMNVALSTYRKLRARAVSNDPTTAAEYAAISDARFERSCIAKAIRLAYAHEGGILGEFDSASALEALRQLMPTLTAQLKSYMAHPRGDRGELVQTRTVDDVVSSAYRLGAAILTHEPARASTFDISDLWTVRVPVQFAALAKPSWSDKYAPPAAEIPLVQFLVDALADSSRASSPDRPTAGFPASVKKGLTVWWMLTCALYKLDMVARDVAQWTAWQLTYESMLKYVTARRVVASERISMRKPERLLALADAGTLWCVGIPMLGREASRALRRLRDVSNARGDAAGCLSPHPTVRAALNDFAELAEAYLVVALTTYDGLRQAQYCYGTWDDELVPVEDAKGVLRGLTTNWVTTRGKPSRVKQGVPRSRTLGGDLLEWEVLDAYVKFIRAPRVARYLEDVPLIGRGTPIPLFVRGHGVVPDAVASPDAHPFAVQKFMAISETTITDRFGEGLHRILTRYLGHELPAYSTLNRQIEWTGVFSQHVMRNVVATCLGSHFGRWDLARQLTLDTEEVLKKKYVVAAWTPAGLRGQWHHIDTYATDLLAMAEHPDCAPNPLDDPHLVMPPAARDLLARWAHDDTPSTARKSRQRRLRLHQQLRSRRPLQQPPRREDA